MNLNTLVDITVNFAVPVAYIRTFNDHNSMHHVFKTVRTPGNWRFKLRDG